MLGQPTLAMYQVNNYYNEKVMPRKVATAQMLQSICRVVQNILKEVESQEPRFISTLVENHGRFEGVRVASPTELEVVLYLNQMGVFNFVDDGSVPGCAVLKLSDGRKRSMSLWVEFITASGFLSARKIRGRFQTLVAQAVDKSQFRDVVKLIPDTSEVRLRLHDKYVVQITCAFRCTGIWPRSASQWPLHGQWPGPQAAAEVKAEGFDLFSKESHRYLGGSNGGGSGVKSPQQQQQQQQQQSASTAAAAPVSSVEGDAWAMSLKQAEDMLLTHGCRRRVYGLLRALREDHLEFHDSPITPYVLKTVLLFECEKHPHPTSWDEAAVGDRLIGVLLQLVSCLQCRKLPHYFLTGLDLLKNRPAHQLDQAAKLTWRLVRQLILNPRALETL